MSQIDHFLGCTHTRTFLLSYSFSQPLPPSLFLCLSHTHNTRPPQMAPSPGCAPDAAPSSAAIERSNAEHVYAAQTELVVATATQSVESAQSWSKVYIYAYMYIYVRVYVYIYMYVYIYNKYRYVHIYMVWSLGARYI